MNNKGQPYNPARPRFRFLTAAALVSFAPMALALSFELGDSGKWRLDWDTNVAYTAQWRVADRDDDQFRYRDNGDVIVDSEIWSELINGDDGDNNFDQGKMVQNKISMVTELDLNYGDLGVFARARAYYDDVYDGNTDLDEEGFLTYNNNRTLPNGDTRRGQFPDKTVDEHRDRLEMLDYFVYYGGIIGENHLFDVRLGSQVINWGEATFTAGINGLQSRADLIARNTPGVEVKEILLPSGALYGQIDVIENLTFEAYYQYEWKETELNGVGSYFSDRDFLGPGARNFLIGVGGDRENLSVVTRGPDEDASDSGQWGAAFHWIVFGDTDLGFYYVNAHNKAPAYQVLCDGEICGDLELPDTYEIQYFEDIQGYAASFTTVLGDTNVQGEIAFKTDTPVVDLRGNPVEGDMASYQLGGSHVFTPNALWDDANLTFELAGAYVTSEDSSDLRYDDNGTVINLRFEPSYLNIVPGWDLKVPIFFRRGLDGVILESEMIEDASAVNIEFQFVYLTNFIVKAGYTNFWDGGENTTINDRDNVSFNVSYSF